MKKILLFACAALLFAGCAKENIVPSDGNDNQKGDITLSFTASQAGFGTKAAIGASADGKTAINWQSSDKISVFDGDNKNCEFSTKDFSTEAASCTFEGNVTMPANDYTAVYPYTSTATMDETDVISGITLPASQTAVEGSFDTKAALMAAKTVDGGRDLAFQNLVGYVKVATDFDCTKIELQAASGEALAGTGSITFDAESGEPSFAIAEETAVSSITLEGTITACKTYYIAVPAQTLAAGWCIRATSAADGIVSTKKGSKEIVFKKNTVLNLGILSQVEPRYVTFSAAETQKFKWDFQPNSEAKAFIPGEGEYFEYRVGDGKWTRFTSSISDIEFGGSGNDLQLRGISSQGTAADSTIYSKFNFTEFVDVYCSGDIRTLVNYKDAGNANTSNARFCYLYKSCFTLRSAPDLPATELASYCYHKLFSDCRKLKSAPVLPATRLAKACYSYMFEDANNISNTPELPALKAEESCYEGMFYDSNIYDAPALPATELAKNCYKKCFLAALI